MNLVCQEFIKLNIFNLKVLKRSRNFTNQYFGLLTTNQQLMNTFKTRRCDSRCHNAKGKRCKCWCQGRHHGLGTVMAETIFLEDLLNDSVSPVNCHFFPARHPDLESTINEHKMPTGKKKVAH